MHWISFAGGLTEVQTKEYLRSKLISGAAINFQTDNV